jgi:hypothetical protein
VTRQQFYGMLTGSVIFDSVETDNRLVLFGKDTTILSPVQISMTFFAIFFTALSFKISRTIPKYPYFIGDIPPICPRKS